MIERKTRTKYLVGFYLTAFCLIEILGTQRGAAQQSSPPAQSKTDVVLPAWDVVSIRVNKSDSEEASIAFPQGSDSFVATNVSLFWIIQYAFNFHRPNQVLASVPWVKTERYDIRAKIRPEDMLTASRLKAGERRKMIQSLLEDKFQLVARREIQTVPIYALVLDKNGPRMKTAAPVDSQVIKDSSDGPLSGTFRMGAGDLLGQSSDMTNLALTLSRVGLEKPVVDKTGLTGKYYFKLHFAPLIGRDGAGDGDDSGSVIPGDASGPSLFTAMQEQLGLRLIDAKGPVECLVVDHVERPVSE